MKIPKITKKCIAIRHSVRIPYISLLILTFLNRCISVKTSLINTKLGDFVNLGVLFLTMLVANPIIYRLVPSPSRFEIRQFWLFSFAHDGQRAVKKGSRVENVWHFQPRSLGSNARAYGTLKNTLNNKWCLLPFLDFSPNF